VGTHYALLVEYFGLKFLPDILHCVYWDFYEVWGLDSSHKIGNKFFICHCQGSKEGSFVCETIWFFFVGEYSSVWPEICRVLSLIQWRFLGGLSGKNYSGRIFQKFFANQGYPLPKLVKFRPNFYNFILGPYCAHKHFLMCFAPSQGGASINESQREETGKKTQHVLFSENRFCSLSVWDSLRLTPWVFWSEIFTRHSHCVYWVLAEVWAPDSSHKIGNKFFIRHCQGWKEGSFVCETV